MKKQEKHIIFVMISPENLKSMSLNERCLYIMLVSLWNKKFWKDIVISLKDLSELSLLDTRYVKLALQKLSEKGYLRFTEEGKTWGKLFTISYIRTDSESFHTDPVKLITDPESFHTDPDSSVTDPVKSMNSALMSANSLILNNTIEYPKIQKDSLTSGLADNAQLLTVLSNKEELSLEEIVFEETNNKTALPITTRNETKPEPHLYPPVNATAKVVSKNGVPHLSAKVTYRKSLAGLISAEVHEGKITIPAHQLPHLNRKNEAALVYNWKNEHRAQLLAEREILLDNVYIEYDN